MKTYQNKAYMLAALVSFAFVFTVPMIASAHRSPDTCSGSGLQISLFADYSEVNIGDVISYSVTVFNGIGSGPVVCDATGITAFLTTPDEIVHPITLLRTALTNGQSDDYPNVVTYTARTQDVKSDGTMTATASDTGTIHQNDTDSVGGAEQGLNTTVTVVPPVTPPVIPPIIPPVTPPVTPPVVPPVTPPSSSSGGGGCAYGYNFQLNRCNYTPIVPPPTVVITQNVPPSIPIVLVPPIIQFPNAGFGPDERSFPWGTVLFAAVLVLFTVTSKTYMYVVNKK